MNKDILDISHHNTILNWDIIKNTCSGVIIRLGYRGYGSEGTLCLDKAFISHVEECKKRNIPYGVYFFPTSITIEESIEESNFILEHVKDLDLSYPIFLDSEKAAPNGKGRSDNLNAITRTNLINKIIETLNAAGYNAGVYASTNWLNVNLIDTAILSSAYIWCAQYNVKCAYTGKYHLWQYTNKGLQNAVKNGADLSHIVRDMPKGKIADTVVNKHINVCITDENGKILHNARVNI